MTRCNGSSPIAPAHRRQRPHLQVRWAGRRVRPLPGGAGRRPRAPGRLPGRRVVAAVGGAPDPAVGAGAADPGVRYAEAASDGTCYARTRWHRWSSSVRRSPAPTPAGRRARRPGRPGGPPAAHGRPGQRHLSSQKGATDVTSRTAGAWVQGPTVAAVFQRALRAPGQAQDRLPRQILETNADTEFGRYRFIAALAELVDAPPTPPVF